MSGYPPGTSTRDLERAGIIDNRPECLECGALIQDTDDHKEDCMDDHLDRADLEEIHHAEANSYDRYEL